MTGLFSKKVKTKAARLMMKKVIEVTDHKVSVLPRAVIRRRKTRTGRKTKRKTRRRTKRRTLAPIPAAKARTIVLSKKQGPLILLSKK